MKFKEIAKWVTKAIIACMIAFAIVSGGCFLYYNIPVHFTNDTGSTDYKWEPSKFYSRGTEGFALGKTDSDGFNNKEELNGRRPDILFMGSSHGEALNVAQDNNCVSLLNRKFDGSYFAYNISMSGHTLINICGNLNEALDCYRPSKYVIIECPSIDFPEERLLEVIDGTVPELESQTGGIKTLVQKMPFLRLIYLQYNNVKDNDAADSTAAVEANDIQNSTYADTLERFIAVIRSDCEKYGVTPIIIYHPHLVINADGSVSLRHLQAYADLFAEKCRAGNVCFADMSQDFIDGYNREHKLPYGFCNTKVGEGHLNNYGHELLAEKIYGIIKDMEAGK